VHEVGSTCQKPFFKRLFRVDPPSDAGVLRKLCALTFSDQVVSWNQISLSRTNHNRISLKPPLLLRHPSHLLPPRSGLIRCCRFVAASHLRWLFSPDTMSHRRVEGLCAAPCPSALMRIPGMESAQIGIHWDVAAPWRVSGDQLSLAQDWLACSTC
jgi:hypothetical protein